LLQLRSMALTDIAVHSGLATPSAGSGSAGFGSRLDHSDGSAAERYVRPASITFDRPDWRAIFFISAAKSPPSKAAVTESFGCM
jgi:hypothetical protein